MDELASKRVLLAGNDVSLSTALSAQLAQTDAVVKHANCITADDYDRLDLSQIDLVLITQLYDPGTHDAFLRKVNKQTSRSFLPVLVLVDLAQDDVQQLLSHGATDFVDINESLDSILEKINLSFAQNDFSVTRTNINITPKQAHVEKPGMRVYVVEDDPLLRNLLKEKLAKSGFEADFSENGNAIVDRLIAFGPNILILDLMLPGKNGLDILKELKANQQTEHIPVIVFSNRDSQTDRQRAKTLGAAAFYVKAMTDLSELVELIQQHGNT